MSVFHDTVASSDAIEKLKVELTSTSEPHRSHFLSVIFEPFRSFAGDSFSGSRVTVCDLLQAQADDRSSTCATILRWHSMPNILAPASMKFLPESKMMPSLPSFARCHCRIVRGQIAFVNFILMRWLDPRTLDL